jgi:RND family efflux transporter MFP subunit
MGVAVAALALTACGAKATNGGAGGPPPATVSRPLVQSVDTAEEYLGQFAAVDQVEIRSQVGGTLNRIAFRDGDVVKKGGLLFVIDPVPYEIKLAQAQAQLEAALARLDLANRDLARADTLKKAGAGSGENLDQRTADQRAASAAVDAARAQVRDARFDLDHTRVTAPFTGRIGSHQVSVGNLVSGNRGGASPTTLLTTLVSLNPIYLSFDMSESDFLAFKRTRGGNSGRPADKVTVRLSDESAPVRDGMLDFVDNSLDRSSGTIHARATVSNPDLLATPGGFGRVRVSAGIAKPTLFVPDAAVLPDQANHVVMTVAGDGTVTPKTVQLGEVRGGLRAIRSGLMATDRVVIEGAAFAAPGSKVTPRQGTIRFAPGQAQN